MAAPFTPYPSESTTMAGVNSKVQGVMARKAWTEIRPDHPLSQFAAQLPEIIKEADYDEMYGVKLEAPQENEQSPTSTLIILQKFLRANAGALPAAKTQLIEALKWRKSYNPLAVRDEVFSREKFGGLGYVTEVTGVQQTVNKTDIACFNIYGAAAKNPSVAFGDTDAFVRWRVALMERTIQKLELEKGEKTIPDYDKNGLDPYQAIQVHDYQSVSFFRQPAEIKASSSKIIDLFQRYYPETVSFKYFVNVPLVMQWMMGAMKAIMSSDSIQKMTWMTNGGDLHKYIGTDIPTEYGGTGAPLEGSALTVRFDEGGEPTTTANRQSPPETTVAAETAHPAQAEQGGSNAAPTAEVAKIEAEPVISTTAVENSTPAPEIKIPGGNPSADVA